MMNSLRGRPMPNRPTDGTRVNEMIRVPEVRLIGADGSQIGIVETRCALAMAREAQLDLVEVSPTAKPPVCRIMDYGKFRFEQAKKARLSKQKQHVVKVKEIKLHPKTAINDYTYRMKQAREFLFDGQKVRVVVQFRGREMAHMDYGKRLLDQAKVDLADIADLEMDARAEGNTMASVFVPKKGISKKKETSEKSEKVSPTVIGAEVKNSREESHA